MADRIAKNKVRTGFVIYQETHSLITEMAKAKKISRNSLLELMVEDYAIAQKFLPEREPPVTPVTPESEAK